MCPLGRVGSSPTLGTKSELLQSARFLFATQVAQRGLNFVFVAHHLGHNLALPYKGTKTKHNSTAEPLPSRLQTCVTWVRFNDRLPPYF